MTNAVGALVEDHPRFGLGIPALQLERLHPGEGAGVGELVEVHLVEGGLGTQVDIEGDGIGGAVCCGPPGGGVAVGQQAGLQRAILMRVSGACCHRFTQCEVDPGVPDLVLDGVGVDRVQNLGAYPGLGDADVGCDAEVQVGSEEVGVPQVRVVPAGVDQR